MNKTYKIEKTFERYINSRKQSKTETIKTNNRPSLSSLVSLLEYTRQDNKDWICINIVGSVKEKITDKWKIGVELSFTPDGDVLIIYEPINKIDKTKPIIPDCKITLLSHIDYKKIREKEMLKV